MITPWTGHGSATLWYEIRANILAIQFRVQKIVFKKRLYQPCYN